MAFLYVGNNPIVVYLRYQIADLWKKETPLVSERGLEKGVLGADFDEALFANLVGGLADTVAEVIEAGAHRDGFAVNFDLVDHGGVDREYALNAFAVADTTDGEGFVNTVAFQGYYDTAVNLDALFVAFLNAGVYADAITNLEVVAAFLELVLGDFADDWVHCRIKRLGYLT